MIAADDDAISAPDTLPTKTIIALIVNNTVVTDGADKSQKPVRRTGISSAKLINVFTLKKSNWKSK